MLSARIVLGHLYVVTEDITIPSIFYEIDLENFTFKEKY